jgi:hypothetical protein
VSQMRWFRWGWIGLSRYMVVNDLKRVDVRVDVGGDEEVLVPGVIP